MGSVVLARAKNTQKGTGAVTPGVMTYNITFSQAFPDATYDMAPYMAGLVALPPVSVTNKTANGFTMQFTSVVTGTILWIASEL